MILLATHPAAELLGWGSVGVVVLLFLFLAIFSHPQL